MAIRNGEAGRRRALPRFCLNHQGYDLPPPASSCFSHSDGCPLHPTGISPHPPTAFFQHRVGLGVDIHAGTLCQHLCEDPLPYLCTPLSRMPLLRTPLLCVYTPPSRTLFQASSCSVSRGWPLLLEPSVTLIFQLQECCAQVGPGQMCVGAPR